MSLGESSRNPVLDTAQYAYEDTNLVKLNPAGISSAARIIHHQIQTRSYSPASWRLHPLHFPPPIPYDRTHPRTKACLNWIFLVSTLNFSFWSEFDNSDRYGVEWDASRSRPGAGYNETSEGEGSTVSEEYSKVWTGYWSLLASIGRALEEGIPITDPTFYASPERCSDDTIKDVFRPVDRSKEGIPLLAERIASMRQVGSILCEKYNGSFQGFFDAFNETHKGQGSALQLVQLVVETFPCFRDETEFNGKKIYFWKRAQILIADTWAAFHPGQEGTTHPLFPRGVGQLTMFADYRVPQILQHLTILTYPPSLITLLNNHTMIPNGSKEEISIRSASILAVERIREEILLIRENEMKEREGLSLADKGCSLANVKHNTSEVNEIPSVLLDFFLWDLAKELESEDADGEESADAIASAPVNRDPLPAAHRTRSIWY